MRQLQLAFILTLAGAASAAAAQPAAAPAEPGAESPGAPSTAPQAASSTAPRAAPSAAPTAAPAPEPASAPEAAPAAEPAGTPEAAPAAEPASTPEAEPVAEPASTPEAEPVADDVVIPGELPPEEEEVRGTCRTPRQAWLQVLWWHDKDPVKAAACFDTSRLADPAREAPILAARLVEHLDASGISIDTANAPTDPNYTDPATGRSFYRDPGAKQFVVVRAKDGRWLMSASSLARIPEPGIGRRLADRLPPWFHTTLFDIEIWQYLGVLVLIFIALTVQKITVFSIRTYWRRLAGRSGFALLDKALTKADRPIGGLSMAVVFYLGFPLLVFPLRVSQVAAVATQALAMYSAVWLAYRLIDVVAEWLGSKAAGTDTKLDDQLIPLVAKTLKVFVSIIGGIFVLQNLNVDVSSLLAGLGLGGLAFALAAKDTVANFFGSVMIFIDKPFQIGDWVIIAGIEGTIEEVGFRTTRIRTDYDTLVTLPNSKIVDSAVDNYGARRYRRYDTTVGLTYDTPPEKVQAFLEAVRALVAGMPEMRKDFYMVEFKGFGESSLDVRIYTFIVARRWAEELRIRTKLNLEILRIASELGVSFALPTRTVYVDGLVHPGQVRPSHGGPREPGELVRIIDSVGPYGDAPRVPQLSRGYDPNPKWNEVKRPGELPPARSDRS